MMPAKARRGWIAPLFVLVVVLGVVISAASGIAEGATTSTLLMVSESSTPLGGARDSSLSAATGSVSVFTVSARDLGDFSAKPPSIHSPAAVVVNTSTGRVLYSRNAEVRRPMASTTKIMTCILCLELLPLQREVTVSKKAAQTPEPKPWLKEGDVLSVEELLYALMVRSSNSAAEALAEACSGSVEQFAAQMNARADEWGMADTHFVNPSGLDAPGHYSTAADMAIVARHAMSNPKFRELVSTRTYTVTLPGRDEPIVFENTNKLLERQSWVTGVKTGLTPNAEQCLVGSGTKNGVSVISVVLGQPSTEVCWDESQALMEYGFSQYRHITLIGKGAVVAEAEVPYEIDGTLCLVTQDAVEMELYKDEEVTTSVSIDRELVLPVEAGEKFGRVLLSVEGETVGSVDLVADKSFAETTLGSKLSYFWSRFAGWIGKIG